MRRAGATTICPPTTATSSSQAMGARSSKARVYMTNPVHAGEPAEFSTTPTTAKELRKSSSSCSSVSHVGGDDVAAPDEPAIATSTAAPVLKLRHTSPFRQNLPRMNVVVLGNSKCGKSAMVERYAYNSFSAPKSQNSGFSSTAINLGIGSHRVTLHVSEASSHKKYEKLLLSILARAQGVVVVYDVTDLVSFYRAETLMRVVCSKALPSMSTGCLMLIGTKADRQAALVRTRQVPEARGRLLASKFGAIFHEISAKDGTGVAEAFNQLACNVHAHLRASGYFAPQKTSFGPLCSTTAALANSNMDLTPVVPGQVASSSPVSTPASSSQ